MNDLREKMKSAVLQAGEVAKSYFGKVRVELKADRSVVTEADTQVDALLAKLGREILPQAAYVGEETVRDEASVRRARESEWVWVVDPIDGTAAFADGIETFCVSLGLLRHGHPYAGAVYFPALNHLYEAEAETANANPESRTPNPESSVSSVSSVANNNQSKIQNATLRSGASLRSTSLKSKIGSAWYDTVPIRVLDSMPVSDRAILYTDWDAHLHYRITYNGKTRGLGSAAFHYLLVARGVAVGAISAAHIWDYAAAACVLEQAGGIIRHLDGSQIDWRDCLDGRNLRPPILGAPPFIWKDLAASITYIPDARGKR